MKLNCDMGESFGAWQMGQDEHIMPHIDMANIACGFHASDPLTMTRTVQLAQASGVMIGAHPGYPDLLGFGRRQMDCRPEELQAWIQYQVGALVGICRAQHASVSYIKPHGAMYMKMMKDDTMLEAILKAAHQSLPGCPLMVLASPKRKALEALAARYQVPLLFEAFSDRAYDDEGYLTDRRIPGAVHQDPDTIINQVKQIQTQGTVTTLSGKTLSLEADTICIHGDGQHALTVARAIGRSPSEGDIHAD